MKKLTIIVEQNEDGYWGQIKEYPNVFTGGVTLTELMSNAREAMDLYFEGSEEAPIRNLKFEIVVDLQEFFLINDFINITKLAERTGMNTSLLRQYAKGLKFPSLEQVARIEKTLKEIGAELLNTHLLNKPLEMN
jgi:predicted RNase H-like HicB family nuclease